MREKTWEHRSIFFLWIPNLHHLHLF